MKYAWRSKSENIVFVSPACLQKTFRLCYRQLRIHTLRDTDWYLKPMIVLGTGYQGICLLHSRVLQMRNCFVNVNIRVISRLKKG